MIEPLEARRLLYSYGGDANLDGQMTGDGYVSGDDYSAIDFNIVAGTGGWFDGDFDFDGVADNQQQSDFSGTAKDDVIVVSYSPDAYRTRVSVNGHVINTVSSRLVIHGNGGNDKIHIDLPEQLASYDIVVYGDAGNDTIVGCAAGERIIAGDGNDNVNGMGGRDTIYAEAGDDSIRGGGSSDLLDGGTGNDTVRGDAGNDNCSGGEGFDRIRGSAGNDTCAGGASKDFIGGELGDDQLAGDGGDDVLAGGEGNDVLVGGAGEDNCDGNDGDDLMAGGSGEDHLFGGGGNDGFSPQDAQHECVDIQNEDLEDGGDAGSLTTGSTITVSGANVSGAVVKTGGSIVVTNGGKLDLTDNQLISSGIITSQVDAVSGLTSIGVATGDLTNFGSGSTVLFAGQTITATSTLAMYTYAGDANLDGLVDGDDYAIIDTSTLTSSGWYQGDFNYDGVISGDDYAVLDFNLLFQSQHPLETQP